MTIEKGPAFKFISVIALGIGMTVLCPRVDADGMRLTGEALNAAISGKKFTGATSRGGTWEAAYMADGTMKVIVLNSDWSDSGTWEIKDDRVCSERTKRTYMCYEVMRVTDDNYHWVDERGQTTVSSGPS